MKKLNIKYLNSHPGSIFINLEIKYSTNANDSIYKSTKRTIFKHKYLQQSINLKY